MNKNTNCPNCGANIGFDTSLEHFKCDYCGSEFDISQLLEEDNEARIERLKAKSKKEIDLELKKAEKKILAQEKLDKETEKSENKIHRFQHSFLFKFLIVTILFSSFVGISWLRNGIFLLACVSFLQAILLILAILIGSQIIKSNKNNLHLTIILIAYVLIVPYFMIYNSSNTTKTEVIWNEIVMNQYLPKPPGNKVKIYSNTSNNLSMEITKVNEEEFQEYINEVSLLGYNISTYKTNNRYAAYNEDAYYILLDYFDKELEINLESKEELLYFSWPTDGLASTLPDPNVSLGLVTKESLTEFHASIYDMDVVAFTNYINECKNAGFNMNFEKSGSKYTAENIDGDTLTLLYETDNHLNIILTKKE